MYPGLYHLQTKERRLGILSRFFCTCLQRQGRKAVVLVFLTLLAVAAPSAAQECHVDNLGLNSSEDGHIGVHFGVQCPVGPLQTMLVEEGGVIRVVFEAALLRDRLFFWKKQETVARRTFLLQNRSLSQEFVVDGSQMEQPLIGPLLGPLLHKAWSTLEMDLGPWRNLQPGSEYTVELRIRCDRADIPVWLRKALFFWSWDVLPPRSYKLHFRY
ncbi:MAG: DUF4390 domain-containing protein [Thermodesulfobacteriota bacterium]